MRLIEAQKRGEEYVLTFEVETKHGFLWRKTKMVEYQYAGSGDVWYSWPECTRVGPLLERAITRVWESLEKGEWPG